MKGTAVVLSLSSVLFLAGCGVSIVNDAQSAAGTTSSSAVLSLQGTVHGGTQAISSASVQLWTVGTSGYGSTGSVVASATSNGSGIFSLPSYTCSPTTELVYLTATSGNPGLSGTNPMNTAISLMTALGPCNTINSSTKVELDEATTVASAYSLAQFMNYSTGAVGYPAASSVGITNAFATVHNLVNTSVGNALSYTPAGNGLVPAAEINTLANMLAYCVNSSGSTASGQPCAKVFAATTYSSSVPANTLQAILNVALHPAYNPTGQFNVVSSSGPFQPTLTTAPNDWTMPVQFAATGAYPSDMAIDASGNIWIASYGGTNTYGGTSEVNNLGATLLSAQYNSSASGIDSIAIDLSGNAWVSNYSNAEFLEIAPGGASSIGPFQLQETNKPESIAVDGNNNVWITNGGGNSVSEISSRGASSLAISPSGGYTGGGLNLPIGVAIDDSNDAWIADLSGNALTEISPAGTVSGGYTGSGLNQPAIVAVDGSGHVWVENNNVNAVAEFNSSGTEIDSGGSGITGGGISAGGGLSVDGGGNIWIADATGNALSEINSSGTVISPTNGFLGASPNLGTSTNCEGKTYSGGNLNYPYATRVDSSGNVWVINYCEVKFSSSFYAGLTEFIGLGTPTITPLAAAVQQGLIGQRPGTSPGTTLTVTSNSLPTSVQTAKYSYQLLAKGGSGNGYTWTVTSGATTLSNLGLTLSSSGLLSGTLSGTVSGAAVGFKVTDSGGSTATATLSLTVNALASLSITTTNIASATVGTNYNQSFTATGGSGSYTWSIPNTSGQLTALTSIGLGYGPRGTLNGTPTSSGNFPFTMQVTDLATGQTASAPYTLVVNNATLSQCTHDGSGNAILNGHYAFLLGGFDPNGHYYDQIGSFVADGAGNISSGLVDANGDKNLSQFASGETESNFSGTYSIGSTDDRGIMTITNSSSSSTSIFCFAADTVVSGVANSGRVIEADGTGYIQTGVFAIQNTANFNAAALNGGYAFGVHGVDTPPNRRASNRH